jgi:cobalt/nickel transport protein
MSAIKTIGFVFALSLCLAMTAWAHFGMVIPDQTLLSRPGEVTVDFMFWHPMVGQGMNLARPSQAGVFVDGKKIDLLPALKHEKKGKYTIWRAKHRIKRPGDYYYYMVPQPYWEPAEDCFIIHYTKAPVSAMGAEEGWDRPLGLKMEIVPLTRPYGLYGGNSFTGRVLYKGKPLAGAVVEVEYYNRDGKRKAASDTHATQVVKTDPQGIFTFAMPWSGWWGFAALHTDDVKIKHQGKEKDVEVGGVIWVKAD